jgi:hypothetical protein
VTKVGDDGLSARGHTLAHDAVLANRMMEQALCGEGVTPNLLHYGSFGPIPRRASTLGLRCNP